jgi:methionyl-tRNA formyltransferase
MMRSLRVMLIAEGGAGMEALRLLAGTSHQVIGVISGRTGDGATGASVGGMAARLRYPVWPAEQVRDKALPDIIRRERVEILLNIDGRYVLPAETVSAPLIGSFNLHPGPLPRYAGLNAPSWAIYQGETSHGVSLHWMDEGIDSGPLAFTSEFPIDPDETGLTLRGKCIRAGLPLLSDLLAAAAREDVPRRPQVQGLRRYYGREVPHQGRLIWSEPARKLVRFIRACDYVPFISPWSSPRAYLAGREIGVLKAELTGERSDAPPGVVGRRESSAVLVAARDRWIRVQRVQVGSSVFPAAEALRAGERFALPAPAERVSASR